VTVLPTAEPALAADTALALHRGMLRIRRFEERAGELFRGGEIPGFIHLSLGQEAVPGGVVTLLRGTDQVTATHRGHGHVIAKGTPFGPMMAELMAKRDGTCGGKGGSMHIFSRRHGVLGANAILGAGQPIAVGAAMSARLRGADDVAVTFFGEGASAQGAVHEAMNLAAVWRAPVLFVAEVNGYAELTPYAVHVPVPSLTARAPGYGMPGASVDGADVEAVHAAAAGAVARMRAGGGPELLEVLVNRWGGHFEGDQQRYRSVEEREAARSADPVLRHRTALLARGAADEAWFDALDAEIAAELDEAVAAARASEPPAPDALTTDVYARSVDA
jgi:TPP-dependent pyruvate/acetoin dehydrogenase alpha subunit